MATPYPRAPFGGDLFEYINFQQRYNIDGRIARALKLAKLYLDPLPAGQSARNMVDDHICWLENRLNHEPSTPLEYRKAKSSEQFRIAEDLPELKTTAGVLLVDAQGHGLISAKIASTIHDTFYALMLVELDRYGKTTPGFFEKINLRLAQSVTARNALGRNPKDSARNRHHAPWRNVSAQSVQSVDLDQRLLAPETIKGLLSFASSYS